MQTSDGFWPVLLALASAVIIALATAVKLLYSERSKDAQKAETERAKDVARLTTRIEKLEGDLDKERNLRVETAERNTTWVLGVHAKTHEQVNALRALTEKLSDGLEILRERHSRP